MNIDIAIKNISDNKTPYIIFTALIAVFGIVMIKGLNIIIIMLLAFTLLFLLLLLNNIIQKNRSYISVILFCLLLLSPLIPTGLALKQYTRLSEIFLVVVLMLFFMINAVKSSSIGVKKTELLIGTLALSVLFSILWGYLVMNIIPSIKDLYSILNIAFYGLCFRIGTLFNYWHEKIGVMLKTIFFVILAVDIISISQLFPWGAQYILPLYMPQKQMAREMITYDYIGSLERIVGISTNPTNFSLIVVIIIALITGWIIYMPVKNKRSEMILQGLLILTVTAMVLTFSRSGLLALIVSQLYILIVAKNKDRKKIMKIISPYILLFVLIMVSSTVIFISIENYFNNSIYLRGFRLEYIFSGEGDRSYHGVSDVGNRFTLWQKGFQKGLMSPIFGWGPATASNIEAAEMGLSGYGSTFFGPHNEFIDIFMVTGLIGLGVFLLFFIRLFRKASMLIKEKQGDFVFFISRSVQAIIIALAIFDLFDGFWFDATALTPSLLMLIFGVMYSADQQKKEFNQIKEVE